MVLRPDYRSGATFCPAFAGMSSPRFLSAVTEPARRRQHLGKVEGRMEKPQKHGLGRRGKDGAQQELRPTGPADSHCEGPFSLSFNVLADHRRTLTLA